MKGYKLRLRTAAFSLLLVLLPSLVLPCSAFLWNRHSRTSDAVSSNSSQQNTPANLPPIAKHQSLTTYRDVAISGKLEATDPEGCDLTYQLTSHPARGALTLSEDGTGTFVYTPYENKTGRDSFTFVAKDAAGGISAEARVSIRITKPDTKVTYADLSGHPAHKAAIRLAEEHIYVGEQVNGHYFFDPNRPVTRARFLTMAVKAVRQDSNTPIMLTGFHDDEAIPTWAKPAVATALKEGAVCGSKDEYGAPVFAPEQVITCGEASAILDKLLHLPDAPVEVFSPACEGHWAVQAPANLTASGLFSDPVSSVSLSRSLTMGEAACLLDGALSLQVR